MKALWRRLSGVFGYGPSDEELAGEFESHLAMQADEYIRRGMAPEEARRQARLRFGGVEAMKESYRDQRGLPWLDNFQRDARQALRGMRRERGFTAVAVMSLALGIGATTALFSVVNSTLLRRLPYQTPDTLALISVGEGNAITAPHYLAFRDQAHSFSSSALFRNLTFDLSGTGEPERIQGAEATGDLFRVLGVEPQLGRAFAPDEDQPGHAQVVIIGDKLWRTRFGADPNIAGRTVTLNSELYTIIGVMLPGFDFPNGPELPGWAGVCPPAQIWRPLVIDKMERECLGCYNFALTARLRGGTPSETAAAELTSIAERLNQAHGYNGSQTRVKVSTVRAALNKDVRTPVLILFSAVALALLIACFNVASLLLARGLRRVPELALRAALGAGRGRLLGQLLTESLILALAAGALAIPVAAVSIRGLVAIAPPNLRGIDSVGLDTTILGFTLALALATTLIFGIAPALNAAWRTPRGGQERTMTAGPSRARRALIAGEIALSLVLVVAASLLVKGFLLVANTPLGFHEEHIVTMQLSLPNARYSDQRRPAVIRQLVRDCEALSGVESTAAVSTLPLTQPAEGWGLQAEDDRRMGQYVGARVRAITPSYFRTLGITLRAGREFDQHDDGTTPVVIVSEKAARGLWPGVSNPVDRRLKNKRMRVVGIAADTRASGLDSKILPYVYVPFEQFALEDFALVVRTQRNPAQIVPLLKREIWKTDRERPVTGIHTMRQLVADSIAPRRFQALLMTIFAAFAMGLAALGIHGVMAYSVEQRRHEIGIRLALGASRATVLSDVLKDSARLAVAGTALGIAASLALAPLLSGLLYGVESRDHTVLWLASLLLIVVAIGSSLIPARRAARLDPMACLRHG